MGFDIPDEVLKRLDAIGDEGRAWQAALPGLVEQLAKQWSFSAGQVMHGGSEALVIEAQLGSGVPAVLKLLVPAVPEPGQTEVLARNESHVLRAAQGRGYVELLEADDNRNALLLARLGKPLGLCEPEPQVQQEVLCETLQLAWTANADGLQLQTGAEKAVWLRSLITTLADQIPDALSSATRDIAIEFTRHRFDAHAGANKVLAHGDAHGFNLLRAPDGSYRLIDPDGLYAEPEYDMGVLMREASEELLETPTFAPVERGLDRCEHLARLSHTDPKAIWQWGFVERVSTGLYCLALNLPAYGRPALAVANSWASQGAVELL